MDATTKSPSLKLDFKVHLTNLGYSSHHISKEAAVAEVKKSRFEASIWHKGNRVASWTVFGGWRHF